MSNDDQLKEVLEIMEAIDKPATEEKTYTKNQLLEMFLKGYNDREEAVGILVRRAGIENVFKVVAKSLERIIEEYADVDERELVETLRDDLKYVETVESAIDIFDDWKADSEDKVTKSGEVEGLKDKLSEAISTIMEVLELED